MGQIDQPRDQPSMHVDPHVSPRQASLAVLRQGGDILVALTDGELLARISRAQVSDLELTALRDRYRRLVATSVTGGDATPGGPGIDEAWRALAIRLRRTLLPAPVRDGLDRTAPRLLSLQVPTELAWVPWEILGVGASLLGEKFAVARRLVTDDTAPPADLPRSTRTSPEVLVVSGLGTAPDGAAMVRRLVAAIRERGELAARGLVPGAPGAGDVMAAAEGVDVIHYICRSDPYAVGTRGSRPVSTQDVELQLVASLGAARKLLVVHDLSGAHNWVPNGAPLGLDACRVGIDVLSCATGSGWEATFDLLVAFYRAVGEGAALAEAVRMARQEVRNAHGVGAVAAVRGTIYGAGDRVLCPQPGRARPDEAVRQVTILSYDLAESTRLIAQLGAERYSEVLAAYHECATRVLTSHGGSPDDPQGDDGAMCYFGFPVAQEDAAARALHGAIELLEGVRALGLDVRIGVCTGAVVVRGARPVGTPVHLAARLQMLARPGQALVGDSTRRIVRERFRFESFHNGGGLKGFDSHEPVHRFLGPADGREAFTPYAEEWQARLTPFIGRDAELATLADLWASSAAGRSTIVHLVGEAGIGKSRLVREFKRRLVRSGELAFEWRCTPELANSPFHPFIEALRAELAHPEAGDARTGMERLLEVAAGLRNEPMATALVADLLGIPVATPHPVRRAPPDRRRALTLDALVMLARAQLAGSPGCLVVEDVHWADPSTLELLGRLAASTSTLPFLVLLTSRTEVEFGWPEGSRVHRLGLAGISPHAARLLVLGAAGNARLPADVVHALAARGDGVPLFIEESTRMAVDLGAARDIGVATLSKAVPGTVLDLLTARLDRLGDARPVAQALGTISQEVPVALLEALFAHPQCPLRGGDVQAQLVRLVRTGMLVRRRDGDDVRYRFAHALMRDAASRSLLERDRMRLHRVVAMVLQEAFPAFADAHPALLALHLGEARDDASALRCWEAAARQAASRSAHLEAIGHVDNALALIARMARDESVDRAELRLHLLLAGRLLATDGYGADRVERAYSRAMALAESLGDEAARMKVMLGLEAYHSARADFPRAMSIARAAMERALASGDTMQRVQLEWAMASMVMHQGHMDEAVRQMDACLARHDAIEHRAVGVQDPGVMCLCYSAWALWQLGCPDEAQARADRVLVRAEAMKHPFSLGEALCFRAAIHLFRGELPLAQESATQAIDVCEEGGFPMWLSLGHLIRGRVKAESGAVDAGILEMQQAWAAWTATGAMLTRPFYLALLAEGMGMAGRHAEGIDLLDEALALIELRGERYYEAEVRRLRGRLMLDQCPAPGATPDVAGAERCLQDALACAEARRLRSLALRAAIDLAGLWHARGRHPEAIALLARAAGAMTEGRGTRDPTRAAALLATWRASDGTSGRRVA